MLKAKSKSFKAGAPLGTATFQAWPRQPSELEAADLYSDRFQPFKGALWPPTRDLGPWGLSEPKIKNARHLAHFSYLV